MPFALTRLLIGDTKFIRSIAGELLALAASGGAESARGRLPAPLDLCQVSRHVRRDLGFEHHSCGEARDWRSFR
jgi:hypothetical protein